MVPGNVVSNFVCCARYVEKGPSRNGLSRMGDQWLVQRVPAERSSGLEEFLYEGLMMMCN